jgi:hypothetical protein
MAEGQRGLTASAHSPLSDNPRRGDGKNDRLGAKERWQDGS